MVPSDTATPYAGSAVVPGGSGPRALATEKLPRAARMVSLADVKEPIPRTWIVRSGILVGLGLVMTLILMFVEHCTGPGDSTPGGVAGSGLASGAAPGSSAGSAKPATKPPTAPPAGSSAVLGAGSATGSATSPAAGQTGSAASPDAGSASPPPATKPKPGPRPSPPGRHRPH